MLCRKTRKKYHIISALISKTKNYVYLCKLMEKSFTKHKFLTFLTMKKEVSNYVSPEVEIIETEVQDIICQSGTTGQYNEGGTDDWFN